MSSVLDAKGIVFAAHAPVLIIGAGAAGLCAALAAQEAGADVVVLERDRAPRGSTALSAGLIPAAGTRFQRERGIADDASLFAADIQRKAGHAADSEVVAAAAQNAAPTIEWLAERHGMPFSVVDDFDYPGHRARRMHGLPSRSGAELIDRLAAAAEAAGIVILTEATATTLFAETDRTLRGVEVGRPDGARERIGCRALVLACSGYGGSRELVRRHIPEMADALYFGHPGNRGDALLWGEQLVASAFLPGYQGHGSVAHPHGILITWATMSEGGFQVDVAGRRFSDESLGYSEQAAVVLRNPGGAAFAIFDERIAGIARQFEDFRQAEAAGAILAAATVEDLASRARLPLEGLVETFAEVARLKAGSSMDRFGRNFVGAPPLTPPYRSVRVTGALFHTQGGLAIDGLARVLAAGGRVLPNLFAAGGAAAGVSGPTAGGYLSGNGLLTAVVLGRIAGAEAARRPLSPPLRGERSGEGPG